MSCVLCGKKLSLIRSLTGVRYCGPEHEVEFENRQRMEMQRRLHGWPSEAPELKKPLKASENTVIIETATPYPGSEAPPVILKTPTARDERAAETVCSLTHGSWRCRCPECLSADRAAHAVSSFNTAESV